MLDPRSAYQSLLDSTEMLLAKTAARVAASPVLLPDSKTAERIETLQGAVAETDVAARSALAKLAAHQNAVMSRRADKVATIVHIANIANKLLTK